MTSNPFLSTTAGLAPNAGIVGAPGAITATSPTLKMISLGLLQFQVPTQAAWAPGMFVAIVDQANSSNWMIGTVQDYENTTLTIDVLQTNGAGTFSAWYINLSAPVLEGTAGPTGPAGPEGAAAGPVSGYATGLTLGNNGSTLSTKADIHALIAIMADSSGTSIRATSVSVTVNLNTGGSGTSVANGMDGEARGTSVPLYFYLISNGVTTAGLATLTPPAVGAPTMPAGYTYALYVGAMLIDSSGNLLQTSQAGRRSHYVVRPTTNTAALPVIASGSAGSVSSPTWVGVTLVGFVPPTASTVLISANGDVGGTGVAVIVAPNNNYGNATSTNPPPIAAGTGSVLSISPLPIEGSGIFWASAGADGYLFCVGWEDYQVAA